MRHAFKFFAGFAGIVIAALAGLWIIRWLQW